MTYKIFMLVREDSTKPLWTPLMVSSQDEEGVVTTVEYQTDSADELEAKVLELLKTNGSNKIRIVDDLSYQLDMILADV